MKHKFLKLLTDTSLQKKWHGGTGSISSDVNVLKVFAELDCHAGPTIYDPVSVNL